MANRKPQEDVDWNRFYSTVVDHEYREKLIRLNIGTMIRCIELGVMSMYPELAFQNSYDE